MASKIKFILIISIFLFSQYSFAGSMKNIKDNPNLLSRYKGMISKSGQNLDKIAALESDARRRNDQVVVNCIKPKLITAKRLYDIAKKSYNKLSSVKKGSKIPMQYLNNEAKKIKMSSDRIDELLKDAQSCLSISSGKTLTKTEIIEGKEEIEVTKAEPTTPPAVDVGNAEDTPKPSTSK